MKQKKTSRTSRYGGRVKLPESRNESADLALSLGLLSGTEEVEWRKARGGVRYVLGSLCIELVSQEGFAAWRDGAARKPPVLGRADCTVSHYWEDNVRASVREITHNLLPLIDGATQDVTLSVADLRRSRLGSALPLERVNGALVVSAPPQLAALVPYEGWKLQSINGERVYTPEGVRSLLTQVLSVGQTRKAGGAQGDRRLSSRRRNDVEDAEDAEKGGGAPKGVQDPAPAVGGGLDEGLVKLRFQNSVALSAFADADDSGVAIYVQLKAGVRAVATATAKSRHSDAHLVGFPVGRCVTSAVCGETLVIRAPRRIPQCRSCLAVRVQEDEFRLAVREHVWRETTVGSPPRASPLALERSSDGDGSLAHSPMSASGSRHSDEAKRVNFEVHVSSMVDVPFDSLKVFADLAEAAIRSAFRARRVECGEPLLLYTRRVFPTPQGCDPELTVSSPLNTASVQEVEQLLHERHSRPHSVWRAKLDSIVRERHEHMPSPTVEVIVADVPRLTVPPLQTSVTDVPVSPRKKAPASPRSPSAKHSPAPQPSSPPSAPVPDEQAEVCAHIRRRLSASFMKLLGIKRGDDLLGEVRVAEVERINSAYLEAAMGRTHALSNQRIGVAVTDTVNRAVIHEEDVRRVKHVFDAIDYDGSGYLSLKELISFSAAHPKAVPNSVFKYVGAGSGQIGFAELLRCHFPKCSPEHIEFAVEQWCPHSEVEPALNHTPETLKEIRAVFETLDTDRKGFLTEAQVSRFFEDPDLAKGMLGGDSVLTLAEFTTMVGPYFINQTEMSQFGSMSQKRKYTNMDWTNVFPSGSAVTYLTSPYEKEAQFVPQQ